MEQTLKSFERGYEELRVAFNENMQVKFGEVREAEAIMHKDLSDAVSLFAERFLKGEVENAMELPHELGSRCLSVVSEGHASRSK